MVGSVRTGGATPSPATVRAAGQEHLLSYTVNWRHNLIFLTDMSILRTHNLVRDGRIIAIFVTIFMYIVDKDSSAV